MRPFLERLADRLLEHHRHEMDRVAVVLPGRRAGLHLRKYLAKASGTALWSPEVLDMGAFLQRISGIQQGGSLELVFTLYEAHVQLNGERADPFAEFIEWATVTLRDMSEVDAHLLDLGTLYRDLREYHELEEWSFRLGELSPGQERLNQRWRSTGELHQAFSKLMNERGVASSGHIARHAATLAQGTIELPWSAVWFAGLNALDPASTAVIKALQEKGLARVAWDADPHYLTDPLQEAGRYLRRSMVDLGPGELEPQPAIKELTRAVRAVAAPNPVAQTTYVAQRLHSLSPEERSRTAVILADEGLLLPFLEQLPSDIGPLNVTMGMPLKALPVNGLTEAFIQAHANMGQEESFLLNDLEKLLGHPFLHEGKGTSALIAGLRALRTVRISTTELMKVARASEITGQKHLEAALAPVDKELRALPVRFIALFTWARSLAADDRSVQEQLFQMARLQQRLDRALDRSGSLNIDLRTYRAIREKLLREERIAFLGEPLRGLQVMGLLETRALDHERVFLVSMNEGKLPTAGAQQSWIPFDVRKHHKLPMPSDGEAISAYHFQRVMHQAKHVELVYNAGDDGGEASRFLAQWKHELVGVSNTSWSEHVVAATGVLRRPRAITVVKDTAVLAQLKALCERGLSPSAIGTWLRCPLDFHFKYILGIRETDVADGTLGSDVLGDAVHQVLQDLFKPLVGKVLSPELIAPMVGQVDRLLHDQLARSFSPNTLAHGHFRLRREMASQALRTYLDAEKDRCELTATRVLAIEDEVQATLPNGALLKGRSDRIDERDGLTMVLDVKTGSVRADDLRLSGLSREAITPNKRYALQLLIYSWAYMQQHTAVHQVCAGVLPLQRPAQADGEYLHVNKDVVLQRDQLEAIGDLLTSLVNEMLDPSVPFSHDPDSTYCRFCVA